MSESHPSQQSRYHWVVESLSSSRVESLGKKRVLVFQSMRGFMDRNHGIPKMICFRPRLTTIRSRLSDLCGNTMRVRAFQRMVPRRLGVPSMLKAPMGWGSFFRGKLARDNSLRSIKFLVAPESMRAEVSTVWVPMSSLMGKRRVRSLEGATST